ncbi:MAG: lipopolysaccharide biosynthesis protein, partial [Nitrososphaerales archaeon]
MFKRSHLLASLLVLLLILSTTSLVAQAGSASLAAGQPTAGIRVYGEDPRAVLAPALDLMHVTRVASPDDADVILLNGTASDASHLAALVRDGRSLVLILGPDLSAADVSTLLGQQVTLTPRDNAVSLQGAANSADPVTTEIQWNSAPQVREHAEIHGATLTPLVTTFEFGETILGSTTAGRGRAYVVAPTLAPGVNQPFQDWAYFSYLIYSLVTRAAGLEPVPFADYRGAPVPRPAERAAILGMLLVMIVTAGLVFALVRRYSLRHPEALDTLIANRERYEERQEGTGWEDIGFHRPLGGFLLAVMLGLVLFVPLIIYQNLILPSYILPSAQALGIWGRVTQFFNVAWLFFDMGTSAAFVKYLAEYRVNDPRRGIMYGQLFVWWQALSGAVQVALIVLAASTFVPRSAYAIYSWSIIIHAFIQIPGFYLVYRHALVGLQRFDYAQLIDIAQQTFLPILAQIPIVILMVRWGQGHPVFGSAMGGLLGLGLAAYATELVCFLLGWLLYRRVGLKSRVLFMAHFDRQVVRTGFRFGVFEMLGSIAWAAGQAAEVAITQHGLINYAETWGNWVVASNFVFAYNVINILFTNLVASISESISHGRRVLSEYYAAQAYRYGAFFSAFIAAVLLAVADRFILGATGPEFTRAAVLAAPMILWGAIQYPSWVSDSVQLGSNRPWLKALMVAGEQIIRVTLAAIFLARFQIWALIAAYFIGLLAKDLVSFIVNDRVCFRQRLYAWPALVAPILAGVAHYIVLRGITGLIWQGDQMTSVLILFIGILLSLPLFAFFYGIFGGWNDAALAELERGAELAGFMRPAALLFCRASRLGARLSPLHGR